MIYRIICGLSLKYAKSIIAAWLCVLAVFSVFAWKLPTVLQDHGLTTDGTYARAQSVLAAEFHTPSDPVILLFERPEQVSRADFRRFIERTLATVQTVDGVDRIVPPSSRAGMEQDGAAFALLSLGNAAAKSDTIAQLRRMLPQDDRMTVRMTGKPVVQDDVNRTSHRDLFRAELIGLPIAFLILWISFGGLLAAAIPIAVGMIGVAGTMGIMYWIGASMELSIFVYNVIPMVGLALSIDFALLMVSRFREQLAVSAVEQALLTTMQTSGRAVFFSSLCVLLGLAGTLFIRMPIFRSVAVGAIIVVAMSMLLTLTFVPAFLSLAGDRMRAKRKPRNKGGQPWFWYRVSAYVMKRPVRMALIAAAILICCLFPLTRLNVAVPDASSLPKHFESRQTAEAFDRYFAKGTSQLHLIGASANSALRLEDWANAYRAVQRLNRDPNVIRVDSVFTRQQLTAETMDLIWRNPELRSKYGAVLNPFVQGNKILITVTVAGDPNSQRTMEWVRNWESQPSELSWLIAGEAKYRQEVFDEVFNRLGEVILFIFASNFVVLFVAFRSILIPIKTVFMNLLSLGASFGILAWIFEEGRFGIEPSAIALMIPVFVFGLAFGVSMDYGVFLLSRIYEAYQRTHHNERSVGEGMALSGKLITSAAAIMIAVTIPFAWGGVAGVKQLGIGISAAILIDATIVRMILVPALMKLFGKWNWWSPAKK